MAEKKEEKRGVWYWVRTDGIMKGIKFNDPIPDEVDAETFEYLKQKGYISQKQAASFEESQINVLAQAKADNDRLRKENENLSQKCESLRKANQEANAFKARATKGSEAIEENVFLKERVAELEAELSDFPKNVTAANKKIKELEKQLSELTAPSGAKK